MRTDNLNDSIITKIIRRLEKLESSGMLNSASISYGRLRFIGGQLLGQAGAALNWIGSATFNGPFSNTGTFTNTGPFNNSGVFTNTGPFNNSGKFTNTGELEQNGNAKFNGNFETTGNAKIGGATEITGATTLKNDLTVQSPGKVVAGNLTINPGGTYGGQIDVGGVGVLFLNAVNVIAADSVSADYFAATLGINSLGDIESFQDVIAGGKIVNYTMPTISGVTSNVYYDPSDSTLKRIV